MTHNRSQTRLNLEARRVSAKGNFARFRRFFEAFGIEVKIVADLDALFEGFQHLGATVELGQVRGGIIQQVDARVQELGIKAEPAIRQIKDKIHQDTWRARYDAARAALRQMQQTQTIDLAALNAIDDLFTWEQDIARVKVCREDDHTRNLLVPILDAMRAIGVCLRSKGAIEDYYPAGAPTGGAKPERALAACELVPDEPSASALSAALADGRTCELREIFTEIFRDI